MGTVTRYSHCLIIWFSIDTSCASEIRTFPPPVVIKISEPFESISLANPSNWTPFNRYFNPFPHHGTSKFPTVRDQSPIPGHYFIIVVIEKNEDRG